MKHWRCHKAKRATQEKNHILWIREFILLFERLMLLYNINHKGGVGITSLIRSLNIFHDKYHTCNLYSITAVPAVYSLGSRLGPGVKTFIEYLHHQLNTYSINCQDMQFVLQIVKYPWALISHLQIVSNRISEMWSRFKPNSEVSLLQSSL